MHILEMFELEGKVRTDVELLLNNIKISLEKHKDYKENEKILKRIIFFLLEYKFTTLKELEDLIEQIRKEDSLYSQVQEW